MKPSVSPQTLSLFIAAYIVQFVYLVIGRFEINSIVVAAYGVMFHPALQNRREFLFRHPLVTAILSGLFLGLLPFHAIASGFGVLSKPNDRWSHCWQKAKQWIAIPFVLGFVLSVWFYAASVPANALSVWQSFFTAPCDLDVAHVLVYRYGCANQLIHTAPLMCSIAYTLTALADRRRKYQGREPLLKVSGVTG